MKQSDSRSRNLGTVTQSKRGGAQRRGRGVGSGGALEVCAQTQLLAFRWGSTRDGQ
jgi:hypothetical protein